MLEHAPPLSTPESATPGHAALHSCKLLAWCRGGACLDVATALTLSMTSSPLELSALMTRSSAESPTPNAAYQKVRQCTASSLDAWMGGDTRRARSRAPFLLAANRSKKM